MLIDARFLRPLEWTPVEFMLHVGMVISQDLRYELYSSSLMPISFLRKLSIWRMLVILYARFGNVDMRRWKSLWSYS